MQPQRREKRNEILLILEGTLFWAGLAFLQGDTVISRFIDLSTGSIALAGLAATLRSVMPMLGQFVMGMFIHKVKKQSRLMAILGFIDRPLFLLMVPLLLTGLKGPAAAAMLLAIYSVFFFMDGAVGLMWIEICTRTLPIRKRGEIISIQQTFGGLMGFAAGLALSRILSSSLSFERQYVVIFVISGLILLVDSVVLALIKDKPHPYHPERPIPNLGRFVKDLAPLFTRDKPVRTVLISRALYLLTLISAPINLVFGKSMGHLTDQQLALLVFMPVIGQTIAGLLWAQVCRRLGYPAVMLMAEGLGVLCALMNLLCFALAAMGANVVVPLSITMILVAINAPAYIGFTQQVIVFAPEERRSDTMVMSSLVLAPLAFGTYFAGLLVERFGYLPVYLVMLAGGLGGVYIVYRNFFNKRTRIKAD